MKHFFIINPASGPKDASTFLPSIIDKIMEEKKEPYEIYITKCHKDSYEIANLKSNNLEEETIFYACGGDGTCFDVINGITGKAKAYFGIIPVGSCNDFIKAFPEYDFRSFDKVIFGTLKDIDIVRANDYYFLNVMNIGFDALVNNDCNASQMKGINVKKAYTYAILKNLIRFKTHHLKAIINDQEVLNLSALLVVSANGKAYGAKYYCAPYALADDGLIDFVVVDKVSRLKFLSLIKGYEQGRHLDDPKYQKIVHYLKTPKLILESTTNEDLVACLDGEPFYFKRIEVEVKPKMIKMLFPRG